MSAPSTSQQQPEEREFEKALFGIKSIDKKWIHELASLAIRMGDKYYKHVVHALETFPRKVALAKKNHLQLAPMFILHELFRKLEDNTSKAHIRSKYKSRVEEKVAVMVVDWVSDVSSEQLISVKRFLNIWLAKEFLNPTLLQKLMDKHLSHVVSPLEGEVSGKGEEKSKSSRTGKPVASSTLSSAESETRGDKHHRPPSRTEFPEGHQEMAPLNFTDADLTALVGLGGDQEGEDDTNLLDLFSDLPSKSTNVPSLADLLNSQHQPPVNTFPQNGGAFIAQQSPSTAAPLPPPLQPDLSQMNFDFLSNPALYQFSGNSQLASPQSATYFASPLSGSGATGGQDNMFQPHQAYSSGFVNPSILPGSGGEPYSGYNREETSSMPSADGFNTSAWNAKHHIPSGGQSNNPAPSPEPSKVSLNGQPDECMLPQSDPLIPPDCIRVLSRTVYVGGIADTTTKKDLYDLFQSVGRVEYISMNREKHNCFIKLMTRAEAELCKSAFQKYQFEDTSGALILLRMGWGCGFGPKDLFDYATGDTLIPFDRLTETDRRVLTTCRRGGGPLKGGLIMEEPETVLHEFTEAYFEVDESGGRGSGDSGPGGARRPAPYSTADAPHHARRGGRAVAGIPRTAFPPLRFGEGDGGSAAGGAYSSRH